MKKLEQHPIPSPSELSSFTFSQIYPKRELERVHSTTTSSLTDLYHKGKDSDSTASTRVPRHNYSLRSQQQRNSQELQSLTSSSTNSKLLRQRAQPRLDTSSLSSSQPTIPSSLSLPFQITSGRKQRELRRLQEQQLILKFEVEVTFNSLGPHPFSLSTRVAHKTTPSPFIATSISYLCDAEVPEIRTGHINFFNPYSGLNYRTTF